MVTEGVRPLLEYLCCRTRRRIVVVVVVEDGLGENAKKKLFSHKKNFSLLFTQEKNFASR